MRKKLSYEDRRRVWNKTAGFCWICKEPVQFNRFTVDHVIPVSKGGKDHIDNFMPAHFDCNLSKGNEITEDVIALRLYNLTQKDKSIRTFSDRREKK